MEDRLATYILIRSDLEMPPGKLAAQVAHAATQSLLHLITHHPSFVSTFHQEGYSGTRIVLKAPSEKALLKLQDLSLRKGLPCAAFIDRDHVLLPHFTGAPVLTALAVGPAPRALLRPLFRSYACL